MPGSFFLFFQLRCLLFQFVNDFRVLRFKPLCGFLFRRENLFLLGKLRFDFRLPLGLFDPCLRISIGVNCGFCLALGQ